MPDDKPQTLTADERAALPPSKLIPLDDDTRRDLEGFLRSQLDAIKQMKSARLERLRRWRKTLDGENPDPPARVGISNVSVPLTMWVHSGTVARIVRAIFGRRPFARLQPAGKREMGGQDILPALKSFGNFIDLQLLSPRGLDGRRTIEHAAAAQSLAGVCSWLIQVTPPLPRKLAPESRAVEQDDAVEGRRALRGRKVASPATVKWRPIRFDDLLYFNGYGTCVNEMPFVGYLVRKTWNEIKTWVTAKHYYDDALTRIKGQWDRDNETTEANELPVEHQPHQIAEIYMDYDIDGDGYLEPILIDFHVATSKILRVVWNEFDEGARPIVAAQFDLPPDSLDFQGQGIPAKLESPQEEANAIHNIGIEAGKRGVAHILVTRTGSDIDDTLNSEQAIIPGDNYSTGDIELDVKTVPLGDPRAAEFAIALEEHNRLYVTRLTGFDESQIGNLESGKRVAASVGNTIQRESRAIIDRPIQALSNAFSEAIYLTIDAWRRTLTDAQLRVALDDDEINLVRTLVGGLNNVTVRDTILVSAQAQDVTASEESRRAALVTVVQLLMPLYDRVAGMLQLLVNPQIQGVPGAKESVNELVNKMQASIKLLLDAIDEIEDPSDVLVDMDLINQAISGGRDALSQPTPTIPGATVLPGVDEEVEARGAGVV